MDDSSHTIGFVLSPEKMRRQMKELSHYVWLMVLIGLGAIPGDAFARGLAASAEAASAEAAADLAGVASAAAEGSAEADLTGAAALAALRWRIWRPKL